MEFISMRVKKMLEKKKFLATSNTVSSKAFFHMIVQIRDNV